MHRRSLVALVALAAPLALTAVLAPRHVAHETRGGGGDTAGGTVELGEVLPAIVTDYRTWARAGVELRLAAEQCRAPASAGDSSNSSAPAATGPRLYKLHARDPAAYLGVESGAPQAHQVIVKETYTAKRYEMPGPGRLPADVVSTEIGLVRPGVAVGLQVMVRSGADSSAGEAAWSYATVTPEGGVTSGGRVKTCAECLASAPYGGLHGIDP